MPVPRQSTAVDFGKVAAPQIQGAQVGAARVDVAKFYDPTGSAQTESPSFMDGLLKIIAPAAHTLGKAAMTAGQDEAYLRGSAAAGTGRAVEEVESNILTKDWATAGYRDTTTRLKAADAEAQTAVDMEKLRELPPAKFAEYLAARRENLYSDVSGMSREGRKAMLTQQLVSERSAIATHAKRHQAFVIDQKRTSISADWAAKFAAMDSVSKDPEAYTLATANAWASIYGNVWQNKDLPAEVRDNMTSGAMQLALEGNHQQLFMMFKNQAGTMPDGSTATMFSRLPFDEQIKLTKAFDASLGQTEGIRAQAFDTQLGLIRAGFDNPAAPALSLAELDSFVADGMQKKFLKRPQVAGLYEDWAKSSSNKSNVAAVAAASRSGDPQALFDLNKTASEGVQAQLAEMSAAKTPLPEVTAAMLAYGLKTGATAAFKAVGELNHGAFATLFTGKEGNPVNAQMVSTVLGQLDWAERERPGATASFLSAFPQDMQENILEFRRQVVDNGGDAGAAAARTAEKIALNSATQGNPGLMAALRKQNEKDDLAVVVGMEPRDLWGTVSGEVAAFFSKSAEDRAKLSVGLTWWGNTEAAEAATMGQRNALAMEFRDISERRPYAEPSARRQMALAAVAARTINTRAAPLTLSRLAPGQTVQSVFGVGVGVMPDSIGAALDSKFQLAKEGNQAAYRVDPRGRSLTYEERDSTGAMVRNETFDPLSLRDIIAEKDKLRGEQYQASHGKGLIKGSGDTAVTYNGNNTVSGLSNNLMLEWRGDLIKYEGSVATPKNGTSTSGKAVQTIGPGIATTNQYYPRPGPDGTVSVARRNLAFMQASNAAAEFGMRATQQAGLGGNPPAFKLMAGMAYQANDISNKTSYKPFIAAMSKRDAAAAKAEFQKTAVWKDAQGDSKGISKRNAYYLDLIDKSMR